MTGTMGSTGSGDDTLLEAILKACAEEGVDLDDEEVVGALLRESIPEMASELGKSLERDTTRMLCNHEAQRCGFERRLGEVWRRPFDLFEQVLAVAYEIGADLNAALRPEASDAADYLFEAMTRLHGRSCQTA